MQAEPARKGGIKAAPGGQRQASRTAGNAWRSDWCTAAAEKSANNAWQCIKGRCAIMRGIITQGASMNTSASLSEGEKILVVDDDARLRRLLERFLDEQGYRVRTVENVEQMDRLLARELFNLVVLDLMLPGEDGLSACRRLREGNNQVPIIMLTAKGDEGSRIQGLEGGADDYLAKPFNPRELLARIKAVLRRQTPLVPGAPGSEDESVSFGDYELSLATRELKKGDEVQMLTTGEFAVLKALVQHAREPLTRDKLMNLARGREWDALERSIDVQISRLRRLIEPDPSKPRYIQTVWGVGYVFVPDGNK
jgi:two-component system phosphate regulon response regulator OmpR